MAGLAGFGQGFSNAINANSVNNERDAQTRILGLQQEALRRAQLGDIYGARALKLMADQIAGTSGAGGPPSPPMQTPPMPGTPSVPMQQGPAIQTAPAPAPMQGAPLPPYQSLDQATAQPPLSLASSAGGAEGGLGNFTSMPDQNTGLYLGGSDQGLRPPGGWGAPTPAATLTAEKPEEQLAPAAGPAQGAPGAVPGGTPTGAAPTQQAPMQVNPKTGLPQGPQLANNLNALNAIRALKQIGAPDDVIMSALGHMEPIFAQEYKATIAAQAAAIHAYQAQMTNAYHQGRLEESAANRDSREGIKAQESADRNRRTDALVDKWKTNHAEVQQKIGIMQQRVDKTPNPNSSDAMQFKYQKQLSDKAHADLHSLYGALSKSADPAEKAVISQQILDKQNEIDGYTKAMVDSYDKLGGGAMERPAGATTSGVPVPPKAGAKAGAPTLIYDPATGTVRPK